MEGVQKAIGRKTDLLDAKWFYADHAERLHRGDGKQDGNVYEKQQRKADRESEYLWFIG